MVQDSSAVSRPLGPSSAFAVELWAAGNSSILISYERRLADSGALALHDARSVHATIIDTNIPRESKIDVTHLDKTNWPILIQVITTPSRRKFSIPIVIISRLHSCFSPPPV